MSGCAHVYSFIHMHMCIPPPLPLALIKCPDTSQQKGTYPHYTGAVCFPSLRLLTTVKLPSKRKKKYGNLKDKGFLLAPGSRAQFTMLDTPGWLELQAAGHTAPTLRNRGRPKFCLHSQSCTGQDPLPGNGLIYS